MPATRTTAVQRTADRTCQEASSRIPPREEACTCGWRQMLIESITAMAQSGTPLMTRVLGDSAPHFWEHYPADDAVDPVSRARWYYHVHAAGERGPDEHGHFHLFLDRRALPRHARTMIKRGHRAKPHVVHIAGLAIANDGTPLRWFATSQSVTDEYQFSARQVLTVLDQFDVTLAPGYSDVGRLLTSLVQLSTRELGLLLQERDRVLLAGTVADVLAQRDIDLDLLVAAPCPARSCRTNCDIYNQKSASL